MIKKKKRAERKWDKCIRFRFCVVFCYNYQVNVAKIGHTMKLKYY